jgi:hypothetical protein
LRAGWICFFIALAVAWIIPLGHVFYSVAIILAIVTLCRMPPRHGLTLLICSLLGIGLSAAISLMVGATLLMTVMASFMQKPAPILSRTAAAQPMPTVPAVMAPQVLPVRGIQSIEVPAAKVQRTMTSAIKTPRSTPLPTPKAAPSEEITIPLNEWRTVNSRYGCFSVKVIDHGPATFSVWINGEESPRRLDKIKGFETTKTNQTLITRLAGADVYYIDRISVSPGYCVLNVVSHA